VVTTKLSDTPDIGGVTYGPHTMTTDDTLILYAVGIDAEGNLSVSVHAENETN